ncbi:TetR family transcriptional regulator [Streptomyces sp. NPDC001780]
MSQERSARTRRLLLRAAAVEFAAHGYSGAHLKTVVAGIGMTKGALYGHFASKAALAESVLAEGVRTWQDLRSVPVAPRAGAGAELRRLAVRLARQMDDDVVFRAAVRLASEPQLTTCDVKSDLLADMTEHTTALVVRAQREGSLTAVFPPETFSGLLTAAILGGPQPGVDAGTTSRARLGGLWNLIGSGGP